MGAGGRTVAVLIGPARERMRQTAQRVHLS